MKNRSEEIAGSNHKLRRALFLDLDGTVRRSKSGATFIKDKDDIEIIPGTVQVLQSYVADNWLIVGISNQGGVAHGFKTTDQIEEEIKETHRLCPVFAAIKAAYAMEEGTVWPYNVKSLLRKPHYGLLAHYEVQAWVNGIIIDYNNSLFVGDRSEDEQCALAAGIKFISADDFFERESEQFKRFKASKLAEQDIANLPVTATATLSEGAGKTAWVEEVQTLTGTAFENLNYDNFWTQAKEESYYAVKCFCDWMDDWKAKNSWDYHKFHHLPLAVQLGILHEFAYKHDGNWPDAQLAYFFKFAPLQKVIFSVRSFFIGLNANILKHK